ncbi:MULTISPECIES: Hsp20/alpha crystallin family protein [unclassified Haladaptatus]|uniref:Hsp20/alpha crystallin family protein n=1 Tax=unclassified Haladaptatus TaxID=2622732 RepID=UPI0023E88BD2|nr:MULTISPECIES: Hsp20/alpha crystallin family protein [unclassified Haladaptatus]
MKRRDDRDPFDDLFREIERMMNDVIGGNVDVNVDRADGSESPHVVVYEETDVVRVIADLPGIDKNQIDLKCDGKTLTITAESDTRNYDEHVTLPVRVDEHSAKATYNNGVLEVTLERAEDSADISVN